MPRTTKAEIGQLFVELDVEELDTLCFKGQEVNDMDGEIVWSSVVAEDFEGLDIDPVEVEINKLCAKRYA